MIRVGKFSWEKLNGVGVERWVILSECEGKILLFVGEVEGLGLVFSLEV